LFGNEEERRREMKFINGNKQVYIKGVPTVVLLSRFNNVALDFLQRNTGLKFTKQDGFGHLITHPTKPEQIAKLFMVYNFKTRYYNNASTKNTLFLKSTSEEEWKK